jgi:DNA-binding NtrC family response regulator
MRILVADDELEIASLMTEMLVDDGHTAAYVTSADEAQQRALAEPWDVVILDTFNATAAAGPDPQLQKLVRILAPQAAVVITTGHLWGQQLTAEQVGVSALLLKPFDMDELLRVVKTVTEPRV